ncbi:MAG TPA: hypothetical protein ENN98_07145, partial [Desulfurivibrio alkaliphilus]|nr:hypothetical protein [Desulfurivibrio alkaliphilus]
MKVKSFIISTKMNKISRFQKPPRPGLQECLDLLPIRQGDVAGLPFAPGDCTAGSENELQVAVVGTRHDVDLPQTISTSGYYADVVRRAVSGDSSPLLASHLENYLENNPEQVWENSWARFLFSRLGCHARNILLQDLQADKSNPRGRPRGDSKRFFLVRGGECWLRLPISYLLKLALADVVDESLVARPVIRAGGRRLLDHFLNDNTSPETFSFHVVSARPGWSVGRNLARETARRFLLSHLLLLYANRKFGLAEHGQRALIFCSPHPPIRQRQLNEGISDAFYRELFMSPCLSGWDEGEDKHRYMALCQRALSRSQLNAVSKLREAGIIVNNLVVLPHTSNINLANNGTHVSLGSRKLTALVAAGARQKGEFGPAHEKYFGDLAVKVIEHFLPLFVGSYSAAPYRLAFEEFHPERVLGFLPHQLDYSHLRMLWRRWRGKARNKVLGRALTPFGPARLDWWLGRLLRLKGDYLPDFRLLDYPVALLALIREDAADLLEMFKFGPLLADLERRLLDPADHGAEGRLVRGIMTRLGRPRRGPCSVTAGEFNWAAEHYYRQELRNEYLLEGLNFIADDLLALTKGRTPPAMMAAKSLAEICGGMAPASILASLRSSVLADSLADDSPLLIKDKFFAFPQLL